MASGISNIITENEITVKIKVPTICTTIDSLKHCLHTFSTNMWEKSRSAQLLFLNCQQRAQITLKLNSGRDWESPSQHRHTHTHSNISKCKSDHEEEMAHETAAAAHELIAQLSHALVR